jgi:biopolymer transport protein TolR
MGAKVGGKSGAESDINVTPLIDVVLVLLIIFMVLTPRVIEEMQANLPSKTETVKKPKDKQDQLVVALYENGDLALNANVLERRELHEQLRKRLRAKEKKVVFVDAHPNLDYGSVVTVMDLVKSAGADRVGMARLKDEGPARSAAAAPAEAPAAPEE